MTVNELISIIKDKGGYRVVMDLDIGDIYQDIKEVEIDDEYRLVILHPYNEYLDK